MHGSHVCVTDGHYVYMRADRPGKALYDYTLLPLHQRAMYAPEELRRLELAPPFSFTKGCPLLKVPMPRDFYPFMSCVEEERRDLLFDLDQDPHQLHPLQDSQQERRLMGEMVRLMGKTAPLRSNSPAWGWKRTLPPRSSDFFVKKPKNRRNGHPWMPVPPVCLYVPPVTYPR